MCVCVCVKNLLKMWPLEFQCGFLKMPPGSHSGFLKLTSSAHRECAKLGYHYLVFTHLAPLPVITLRPNTGFIQEVSY